MVRHVGSSQPVSPAMIRGHDSPHARLDAGGEQQVPTVLMAGPTFAVMTISQWSAARILRTLWSSVQVL